MKLKIKNPFWILLIFGLTIFSFSLPFLVYSGTDLIANRDYLWFVGFQVLMIVTIIYLVNKSYFELIRAEVKGDKLVYYNFLFLKKTIDAKKIRGYKIDTEDGALACTLYGFENKKIAILRFDIYSNVTEFIEELKIEHIEQELTGFQKLKQKIFKIN